MCGFLALVIAGPAIAFPQLESDLAAASAEVPSFSAAVGASVRWDALDARLSVPAGVSAAEVGRIAADLAAIDGARSVTIVTLPVRATTPSEDEADLEPQPPPEVEVEVEAAAERR